MKTSNKLLKMIIVTMILTLLVGCSTPATPPLSTVEPIPPAETITVIPPTDSPTPTETLVPTPAPQLWVRKQRMPTARFGLTTSVVDGMIYAIGGKGGLTVVEEYDPITDSWTRKADMPTGRGWITSSVLDGKIYVMGGNTKEWGTSLATVEMYDPSTDTWTKKADMTTPRDWLASTVINGKIYAMGGDVLSGNVGDVTTLSSVEEYDPETDTWTLITDMRRIRRAFSAVVVDNKIYAIGSFSPYEEMYEPGSAAWVKVSGMPKPRMGAAVSVVDGKIYVFGGEDEKQGPPTSVVYKYDPAADSWTTLSDMPYEAFYMSSSVVDGKIYIFGGSENVYPHPAPHLSAVWEYSPD